MKRPSVRVLWWLLVAGAGGMLACLIGSPSLFRVFGVNHYGTWFLDTYAILASNDALAHGFDVYRYNPLDYFGRPHVYPHWWLLLGRWGLTRGDCAWLGFTWGAAFFVAALTRLRPRSWGELGWNLFVLCSPSVLLALDRGNNDLVLFVMLAPLGPLLLARSTLAQVAAIVLIAVATALKTYPAVAALLLLAGGEPRAVRWRLAAMAAVFAAMAFDLVRDFSHYGGLVPRPDGLMTFGAANLFLLAGADAGWASVASLLVGGAMAVWLWHADLLDGWRPASDSMALWLSLVLGAVLLTGCFFAGMSYAYRWVFSLWMLPLLWQLRADPLAPGRARRLATTTIVLLTITLWMDAMASMVLTVYAKRLGGDLVTFWADRVWQCEQPLTWALFACLMAFLVRFVRDGWATLRGSAG